MISEKNGQHNRRRQTIFSSRRYTYVEYLQNLRTHEEAENESNEETWDSDKQMETS